MDKRLFLILAFLTVQALSVDVMGGHRYRMLLDIAGNCTDGAVLVTVTNEVNERPVRKADVDVFLFGKRAFNLETNDSGTALFAPATTGSYLIQVDKSGYLRAETAVDVSVCGTTITTSTAPTTVLATTLPETTIPTTTTAVATTTVQETALATTSTAPERAETAPETTVPLEPALPAAGTKKGGSALWGIAFFVALMLVAAIVVIVVVLMEKKR